MPRQNPNVVPFTIYFHRHYDADLLDDIEVWKDRDEANSNIRRLIRIGKRVEQGYSPPPLPLPAAPPPVEAKPARRELAPKPEPLPEKATDAIGQAKDRMRESIGGFGV